MEQFWTRVVILTTIILESTGQNKTEYFLAFADNKRFQQYDTTDPYILISTKNPCGEYVTITSSSKVNPVINTGINVSPGKLQNFTVDRAFRSSGIERSSKGIKVSGSNSLVVFGVNSQTWSADGFLVKPSSYAAMNYYTTSYFPSDTGTLFLILGIENDTEVNVKLSTTVTSLMFAGETFVGGDTITFSVEHLETVQFVSSDDLTGTSIKSSKPVVVYSGNSRTKIGSIYQDHLIDQVPPGKYLGRKYPLFPNPVTNTADTFRIVSIRRANRIKIACADGEQVENLSKEGDFYQFEPGDDEYCSLVAEHPVYVARFVRQSDPAMAFLIPVEHFGSTLYLIDDLYADVTNEQKLVITIASEDETGLLIDGATPSLSKSLPIGVLGLKVLVETTTGHRVVTHESATAKFAVYVTAKTDTYETISTSIFSPENQYMTYTDYMYMLLMTTCGTTGTDGTTTRPVGPIATIIPTTTNLNIRRVTTTPAMTTIIAADMTTINNLAETTTVTPDITGLAETTTVTPDITGLTETTEDGTTSLPLESDTYLSSTLSDEALDITTKSDVPSPVSSETASDSGALGNVCLPPSDNSNNFSHCTIKCFSDLEFDLKKLREELLVPKKSTTKYKLTLTSASDNRPSAVTIGSLGLAVCITFPLVVIAMDLQNLKEMFKMMFGHPRTGILHFGP